MKNANVALFIPNKGCRNECSFCNQKSITGQVFQPDADDVRKAVRVARSSLKEESRNAEIAFFGGSFTAIERKYMLSLLRAAYPFVESGEFKGIRISTRPDYIDDETLRLLKELGVSAIELGAQSMDDEVLNANRRGHTREDVVRAAGLVKKWGFSLGLQMMTGLYKTTVQKDYQTAQSFVKLVPDTVRIYPTVVIRGTELGELYERGEYMPFSVEETVEICSRLLKLFEDNGIKVIRLGLHASKQLEKDYIAGSYHPALHELCRSAMMLDSVREKLRRSQFNPCIDILVNEKDISKIIGHGRKNIAAIKDMGYDARIKGFKSIKEGEIRIINSR